MDEADRRAAAKLDEQARFDRLVRRGLGQAVMVAPDSAKYAAPVSEHSTATVLRVLNGLSLPQELSDADLLAIGAHFGYTQTEWVLRMALFVAAKTA